MMGQLPLDLRGWHRTAQRPILENRLFIALGSISAGLLQLGTFWSTAHRNSSPSDLGRDILIRHPDIAAGLVGYVVLVASVGVIAQFGWKVEREVVEPPQVVAERVKHWKLTIVAFVMLQVLVSGGLTGGFLATPGILFIAVIEGIILGLTFGKSNSPMLPRSLDSIADKHKVDYLEITMVNCWRWTQGAMGCHVLSLRVRDRHRRRLPEPSTGRFSQNDRYRPA